MNLKIVGLIVVLLGAAAITVYVRPDILGNITGIGSTVTGKEPLTVPDMYDFSKFKTLNSKLSLGGPPMDVKTEFSETTFKGVSAYRIKGTSMINGVEVIEDSYYNKDGIYIGGYLDGEELQASEWAENYKDHCWIRVGKNFPLTKVGPETITVGGKTYQCTKYTADRSGILFTFWWTSSAPIPVKVMAQGMTEEFVGWS